MKAKDITNSEMNKLCKENYPNCPNCPLKRPSKQFENVLEHCHRWLRANYYADLKWYKEYYQGDKESVLIVIEQEYKLVGEEMTPYERNNTSNSNNNSNNSSSNPI